MAWSRRKEDKPFDLSTEDLVLVEYQDDGRLYLVSNPQDIGMTYNDIVVVSHLKVGQDDKSLPYSVCRVLGFTSKAFKEVMEFVGLDLANGDFFEAPRYHEECIICNITNPNAGKGGAYVQSVEGKKSSSEDAGDIYFPQKQKPQDAERKQDYIPQDKRGKVNESEDVWNEVEVDVKSKEKELSVQELLEQGEIFDMIIKTEH